jgi:hypothetical protein
MTRSTCSTTADSPSGFAPIQPQRPLHGADGVVAKDRLEQPRQVSRRFRPHDRIVVTDEQLVQLGRLVLPWGTTSSIASTPARLTSWSGSAMSWRSSGTSLAIRSAHERHRREPLLGIG